PLPGARRLALRLRSHGAGASSGPREHRALRARRAAKALARGGRRQGRVEARRGEAVLQEKGRATTLMISHQDACALVDTPAAGLPDLLGRAGELRARGRGRTVTFAAKVFVPPTTLCRGYCGYCPLRRAPAGAGAPPDAPP